MGNRKSQVDKFNARYAKATNDTNVVTAKALEERKASPYGDVTKESTEELMQSGSIKEAAVVFSHEGIQAFARMFGNSMEVSVEKVLTERIDIITESMQRRMESVIEAKMIEMLDGMTEGMRQMATTKVIQKASITKEEIEELQDIWVPRPEICVPDVWESQVKEMEEAKAESIRTGEPVIVATQKKDKPPIKKDKPKVVKEKPVVAKEKSVAPVDESKRLGLAKDDISLLKPLIVNYLKDNGDCKATEIVKHLTEQHGLLLSPNTTMLMNSVMKRDHNIEKVGYGTYRYEEKSFG